MRSNCETDEEYNLSKYLFESFLRSDKVVEVAGVENSEKILSFVCGHMQPHEPHYCFHLRKCVQHFDTHINSSHEGTNKGIKYGAAPCLPNYSIERAAKVLTENGVMKSQMCAQKAGSSHLKSKLWSKLPTSEHVVDLAEALVTAQWKEKETYECICTSERMFLLVRLGIDLP